MMQLPYAGYVVVFTAIMLLSGSTLACRLCSKVLFKHRFTADDWLLVLAWSTVVTGSISFLVGTQSGSRALSPLAAFHVSLQMYRRPTYADSKTAVKRRGRRLIQYKLHLRPPVDRCLLLPHSQSLATKARCLRGDYLRPLLPYLDGDVLDQRHRLEPPQPS